MNIYFSKDVLLFQKLVRFIEKQHDLAGNPVLFRCHFILRSFCEVQAVCYFSTRLSSKTEIEIPFRTQNIDVIRSDWTVRYQRKKQDGTPIRACCVWLPFFDSVVCAYSVYTHNAPLFSLKHSATAWYQNIEKNE